MPTPSDVFCHLYRWGDTYQPHYVVAKNYADAEATIRAKYGGTMNIDKIEDLGSYVQISDAIAAAMAEGSSDADAE